MPPTDPTPTPTPLRLRKKPVVVDAIRYDGEFPLSFLGDRERVGSAGDGTGALLIHTLEGTMRAEVGDYIIRGVKGELYPCKPDIVAATYEDAALAATGDAPLTAERVAELRGIFESSRSLIDERCGLEALTAYTTLAAQCAAVRAERDALREELDNIAKAKPTDWSDIEGDTYYEFYLWAQSRARHTLDRFATPARPTDTGRDG